MKPTNLEPGQAWGTCFIRLEKHQKMAESLMAAGNYRDALSQLAKMREFLLRVEYEAMNKAGINYAEVQEK